MVPAPGRGRRRERTTAMQTVDAMPSHIRSSPCTWTGRSSPRASACFECARACTSCADACQRGDGRRAHPVHPHRPRVCRHLRSHRCGAVQERRRGRGSSPPSSRRARRPAGSVPRSVSATPTCMRTAGSAPRSAGAVSRPAATCSTRPPERSASGFPQRLGSKRRSRRLLVTTKTELKAMAAPAMSGFSSPRAASGSAATL